MSKWKIRKMLLFCLVIVILSEAATGYPICPNRTSSTDIPKYTKPLGDFDYVQHGQSIALQCCSEGVRDINWYRLDGDNWTPFPPSTTGQSDVPQLQEQKQILRIYHATFQDNTTFRCDLIPKRQPGVVPQGAIISHKIWLHVVACDVLSRGPILTEPFPRNQYIDNYGVNLTVPCAGYFGCSDGGHMMGNVEWFVRENGMYRSVANVSSRYKDIMTVHADNTVMRASLSVSSVEEVDINRKFVCILSSPELVQGQSRQEITIIKAPEAINKFLWIGIAAGGVFVLVLVIIMAKFVIGKLWGPQIKWYLRSRITFIGPKPAVDEECIHNAFIYHAEEDIRAAYELKKQLQEQHFDIFLSSDVPGNKPRLTAYQEASIASAVVVILYSENLWKDPLNGLFFQSIVEYRKGKGILFLEIEEYSPEKMKTEAAKARENKGKEADDKIETSLEEDCVAPNPKEKIDKPHGKKEDKDYDLKFWRALPRLKVPSEKASVRKKTNFHCSIQNQLPLLKHQVCEKRQKSSSNSRDNKSHHHSSRLSERPLISDCPSPGGEISPLSDSNFSDEVFEGSQDRKTFVYDNIAASRDAAISNSRDLESAEVEHYSNDTTVIVDVDVHNIPKSREAENLPLSHSGSEANASFEVIQEIDAQNYTADFINLARELESEVPLKHTSSEANASFEVIQENEAQNFTAAALNSARELESEQGVFTLSGDDTMSNTDHDANNIILPVSKPAVSVTADDKCERHESGFTEGSYKQNHTEFKPGTSDSGVQINQIPDKGSEPTVMDSICPQDKYCPSQRAVNKSCIGPHNETQHISTSSEQRQPRLIVGIREDSLESSGSNSHESGYVTSPSDGALSPRSVGSSPEITTTVYPFMNVNGGDINTQTRN